MPIIIGVKFRVASKVYFFDPKNIQFEEGDGVIVETARGQEFGKVAVRNKEVDEKQIVAPLKEIIRKANDDDEIQLVKNEKLRVDAMKSAEPKISELNPEMKLVDIEYTFDQSKIIFYFTADGRVDFRELVRVLASMFKRRIEMRQIDERDDFKLRGGLAICGRPCCCTKFLNDCDKVSIKMAKTQGLPLNPTKISGLCGKLMCCLKYENEYYLEVNKKMPKYGAKIMTPEGEGTVEGTDALRQLVNVRYERSDGIEKKKVPLADIIACNKDIKDENDSVAQNDE